MSKLYSHLCSGTRPVECNNPSTVKQPYSRTGSNSFWKVWTPPPANSPSSRMEIAVFGLSEHSRSAKLVPLWFTFFCLLLCKISGSRRLSPVQTHYGIKWCIFSLSLQLQRSCQCSAQNQQKSSMSAAWGKSSESESFGHSSESLRPSVSCFFWFLPQSSAKSTDSLATSLSAMSTEP